ncbi:hypothetical protein LMH73_023165 [Vibrio splendidus]|nr:hypothetical protein [Vibrio splendidus]MCC4883220.1 hypothetical protein [Vibrio splendidus]
MSSTTCHLSSIEIREGDDVVILPVKYRHLTETCQLVYGTNSSCTIAHLPLFGKYGDYGQVKLNEESEENCTIFRKRVNKYLMNNSENRAKKNKDFFYCGDSFYVFKRQDFDEAESCEWSTDIELIKQADNELRHLNIDEIDSNEKFLNFISIGALVEADKIKVNRFGYILIRRDIYSAATQELYFERSKRVQGNIKALLNSEFTGDVDTLYRISESYLSRDILELHNFDNYLVFQMLELVRLLMQANRCPESFIDGLLHWSLVSKLYSDLGKSFYPNVRRHGNMKPVYTLNSIVQKHIDNRRLANKEDWLIDNDAKEPTPESKEWDDYLKLD